MDIKAKSKYDYEAIRALIRISAFKKDNPKVVYIVSVVYGLSLAMIITVAGMFYGWMNMYNYLLGVIVFILLLMNWAYFWLPKITYNKMVEFRNLENEFTFLDDSLKIISKNGKYTGEAEFKYSILPKVIENSKYILVYQNKSQAYIVDKSTIEGGTVEELRNVLQAKINGKYIICKY